MALDEPKILISLTSVPPRFERSLPRALEVLCAGRHDVVLSVPRAYRKWPNPELPASIETRADLILHRPDRDWGPATKLLGAIDYILRESRELCYDYIITFDDDIWYRKPDDAITLLRMAAEAKAMPTVVTFGGFRMLHPPFARKKRGLQMNNTGFVDAVCGFQGVLYPTTMLLAHQQEFFNLHKSLSDDVFHDDDVYFGIVCGKIGVPIWAIPRSLPEIGFLKGDMIRADEQLESAVDFLAGADRRSRQPLLFQEALELGFLPNPYSEGLDSRAAVGDKSEVSDSQVGSRGTQRSQRWVKTWGARRNASSRPRPSPEDLM